MFDHQATDSNHALLNWEYRTVPETCFHPDCGTYISYGIQAYQCCGGHCQLISAVHDISTKQSFVEQLTILFTKQQLSPLHLLEVITDFLPWPQWFSCLQGITARFCWKPTETDLELFSCPLPTVCQRFCCQSVYRATKKDSPFVFHVSAENKKAILNELKIKRLSYNIHMMPKKH